METTSQPGTEVRPGEVSSGVVSLGRLMWMILGPMLSLFITHAIVTREGWFTTRDAAYGAVVALMVGGRWVEQQSGAATTATGRPATSEHFRRYIRILLPAAAGVWGMANVLGNHVLT